MGGHGGLKYASGAWTMLCAMAGVGIAAPQPAGSSAHAAQTWIAYLSSLPSSAPLWLAVGLAIVWFAPNTQTLAARLRLPTLRQRLLLAGALSTCVFLLAAINHSRGESAFIYFNF